jgi:3-deoxy-D-arabino-heptulosonate 7-phosphate (DAHP) synthase
LPIIVAVTSTGVQEKLISSAGASVLVGAGMLSVLVFPLTGMRIRGETEYETALEDDQA